LLCKENWNIYGSSIKVGVEVAHYFSIRTKHAYVILYVGFENWYNSLIYVYRHLL